MDEAKHKSAPGGLNSRGRFRLFGALGDTLTAPGFGAFFGNEHARANIERLGSGVLLLRELVVELEGNAVAPTKLGERISVRVAGQLGVPLGKALLARRWLARPISSWEWCSARFLVRLRSRDLNSSPAVVSDRAGMLISLRFKNMGIYYSTSPG